MFVASEKLATYFFVSTECSCGEKLAKCLDESSIDDEKQIMEELYSAVVKKRKTKKFEEIKEIFNCTCWKVSKVAPEGEFFKRNVRMFDEE